MDCFLVTVLKVSERLFLCSILGILVCSLLILCDPPVVPFNDFLNHFFHHFALHIQLLYLSKVRFYFVKLGLELL